MEGYLKKRIALSITALLFMLGVSVAALQAAPSLDLGPIEGCAMVTIPITLTNEPGIEIVATSNDIAYDPDYFSFVECTIGPAGEAANKEAQYHPVSPGLVRVGVFAVNLDSIPDGIVAYVIFEILDGTPCNVAYTLSNIPTASDASGTSVEVAGAEGEIFVLCDIDDDDICDVDDNCPEVANGPDSGTCICGGESCMSDDDCEYGACSMDQEDSDNDGLGDACDESLCQSYLCRYECCMVKQSAGREVDYDVCKEIQDEGDCIAAGCTWHQNSPDQAFPCMLDICLSESTGDDYVGAMDFAIFKREQGRSGCPTIEADDLCQSYYEKHLLCLDKQSSGREVDYNACKDLSASGQTVCENAGCTWHQNSPNQVYPCMLDICLSESTGDDYVGAMDFAIFKREQGRGSCPCSP